MSVTITLIDEPHLASIVLDADLAAALKAGDEEAHDRVLDALHTMLDAYLAMQATARHDWN